MYDQSMLIIEMMESDLNGAQNSTCDCPIARAIRRQCGIHIADIFVGPRIIKLNKYKDEYYSIPEIAKNFIRKFDAGMTVNTITFALLD